MSVRSWLKLAVSSLACRARRPGLSIRWLVPIGLALAAWSVTVPAVIGCGAAWLRGWPSARLRRSALFFLPFTACWLGTEAVRLQSWRGIGLAPADDWEHGWRPLTVLGMTRAFLLVVAGRGPDRAGPGGAGLVRGGTTR